MLRWSIEWEPHQSLAALPEDVFGRFPQPPDLSELEEIQYEAFTRITQFREFSGMGGPLPIGKKLMLDDAEMYGPYDVDDRNDLITILLALDHFWMQFQPGK